MKRALPAKRSAPVCYLRSNRQAGELGRLLLFMCLEQADNANDQDPDLNQISKLHPRWTRANTLSSGKKSALDIVIVLGGRQPTVVLFLASPDFSSLESPAEFFGSGNRVRGG